MKYYEFVYPYSALVVARDSGEALNLYKKEVCEVDKYAEKMIIERQREEVVGRLDRRNFAKLGALVNVREPGVLLIDSS